MAVPELSFLMLWLSLHDMHSAISSLEMCVISHWCLAMCLGSTIQHLLWLDKDQIIEEFWPVGIEISGQVSRLPSTIKESSAIFMALRNTLFPFSRAVEVMLGIVSSTVVSGWVRFPSGIREPWPRFSGFLPPPSENNKYFPFYSEIFGSWSLTN